MVQCRLFSEIIFKFQYLADNPNKAKAKLETGKCSCINRFVELNWKSGVFVFMAVLANSFSLYAHIRYSCWWQQQYKSLLYFSIHKFQSLKFFSFKRFTSMFQRHKIKWVSNWFSAIYNIFERMNEPKGFVANWNQLLQPIRFTSFYKCDEKCDICSGSVFLFLLL